MNDNFFLSTVGVPGFVIAAVCLVGLISAIGGLLRWLGYGSQLKAMEKRFGPTRNRINRQVSGGAFSILNATIRSFNRKR